MTEQENPNLEPKTKEPTFDKIHPKNRDKRRTEERADALADADNVEKLTQKNRQ